MNYEFDHIGITVAYLESAIEDYKNLGFRETRRADKPHLKLELATIQLDDFKIELIQPYKFITLETELTELHKIGAKHIAFSVDNLIEAYNELKDNTDITFIKQFLDKGMYFCTLPGNTLIEIMQKK